MRPGPRQRYRPRTAVARMQPHRDSSLAYSPGRLAQAPKFRDQLRRSSSGRPGAARSHLPETVLDAALDVDGEHAVAGDLHRWVGDFAAGRLGRLDR